MDPPRKEGNIATIGITDYAQYMLGEIVSVDLPENGDSLYAGESFGGVKSVEFVTVLCTPVGGEVSRSTKLYSMPPGS